MPREPAQTCCTTCWSGERNSLPLWTRTRILLVEGADDKHVVRHLCNAKPDIPAFEIADKTGFPALIRAIGPEIKAPGRLAVGILAMRTTIRRHGGSR